MHLSARDGLLAADIKHKAAMMRTRRPRKCSEYRVAGPPTKLSAPVIAQTLAVSRASRSEAFEANRNPFSATKLNLYDTAGRSLGNRWADGGHGCTGVRHRRNREHQTKDR